jgi:DNA-binding NarL/FixJ family response regulator
MRCQVLVSMKKTQTPAPSTRERKISTVKIAIVDDDDGIRVSLAQSIRHFEHCECVGRFASGEEAVAGIPALKPDVVLMDINMPGMNGIECARQLKRANEGVEIIMLTVYEDTGSVFDALSAGASGYLLKRAPREELLAAIQQVYAGGSPMSSHIARKVVQSFRKPVSAVAELETEKLTPREQEILEKLAKGFLYKEISDALGISYETVNNHIRHIYKKLHIRSRSQAVAKFYEQTGTGLGSKR